MSCYHDKRLCISGVFLQLIFILITRLFVFLVFVWTKWPFLRFSEISYLQSKFWKKNEFLEYCDPRFHNKFPLNVLIVFFQVVGMFDCANPHYNNWVFLFSPILLRVLSSNFTSSVLVLVLVRPSRCLPALFVESQRSCGPCPNFFVLAISACNRAVDPRSPSALEFCRSYCASRGSHSFLGQLVRASFSRFFVVQGIPATRFTAVATAFPWVMNALSYAVGSIFRWKDW